MSSKVVPECPIEIASSSPAQRIIDSTGQGRPSRTSTTRFYPARSVRELHVQLELTTECPSSSSENEIAFDYTEAQELSRGRNCGEL